MKTAVLVILISLMLPTLMYGEALCGKLTVYTDSWDADSNSVKLRIDAGHMHITRRYYGVSSNQYSHLKKLRGEEVILRYHITYNPVRFWYDSCVKKGEVQPAPKFMY